MADSKLNLNTEIVDAIKSAIKRNVEAEFEEKKKQLIRDLDLRKDEICAGILIDVMRTVDIQSFNDRVIVTIRKIEDKK